MIPQSFITDLLNRVDIVDVVGKYVPLKKGGINLMGLCPFHGEKSPSFTVSPTKQFYHCFGCGAHGSAISFLMEYAGLSYVEAIKQLAHEAGMTVPEEGGRSKPTYYTATAGNDEETSTTLTLSEVLSQACQYYRQQLRSAPQAIDYLKNRGLTGTVAAHFGLGYAPEAWRNLAEVFHEYESPALVESGLVIVKEEPSTESTFSKPAKRYDRFRDRIMFPIRNSKGQVIGFGGRVLGQGEPKYLNSPETPLFHKGQELYGLFEARQAIRQKNFVLVVEGYMDVVALAQFGFANVVATLGTACTATHIQKLIRQTDHIIFSFDGDAAGRRAARRALEAALPYAEDNKVFQFLFLPSEHDPDSYIRDYGQDAFDIALKQAMPLSSFVIAQSLEGLDLHTPEARAQALFQARQLLALMPSGGLRLQIARALGKEIDAPAEEIEVLTQAWTAQREQTTQARSQASHLVTKNDPRYSAKGGNKTPPFQRRTDSPLRYGNRVAPESLEKRVALYLLASPNWVNEVSSDLSDLLISTGGMTDGYSLYILIKLMRENHASGNAAMLMDIIQQNVDASLYESFFVPLFHKLTQQLNEGEHENNNQEEFIAALRKLEIREVKQRLDTLSRDATSSSNQQAEFKKWFARQQVLQKIDQQA